MIDETPPNPDVETAPDAVNVLMPQFTAEGARAYLVDPVKTREYREAARRFIEGASALKLRLDDLSRQLDELAATIPNDDLDEPKSVKCSGAISIDHLAKLGSSLIKVQFERAVMIPREAMSDLWVLGYCFGLFDALVQRQKLHQYTDGLLLITIGFAHVLSRPVAGEIVLPAAVDEAGKVVANALENQTEPRFFSR